MHGSTGLHLDRRIESPNEREGDGFYKPGIHKEHLKVQRILVRRLTEKKSPLDPFRPAILKECRLVSAAEERKGRSCVYMLSMIKLPVGR